MEAKKPTEQKIKFYQDVITELNKSKVPYLLGGTYAVREYTGITRETKDLDFFCKVSDAPKILNFMKEKGFKVWVEDERYVGKITRNRYYVDLIMGSFNSFAGVDDTWFENAPEITFLGKKVKITKPEDLIWSKIYVSKRGVYHGSDINHLFLKQGKNIDWKRLLLHMEQHWELLFSNILNFRFIYPSERGIVPQWLLEELINRVKEQLSTPLPQKKISRGRLFSTSEYQIDFEKWGFEDTFTWT